MSPKVIQDFCGFQFFTFPNENGEPVHIHVSRRDNHNQNLKFWLVNDSWVLDAKQSTLRVTLAERNKIINYLNANADRIIRKLYAFHTTNLETTSKLNMESVHRMSLD